MGWESHIICMYVCMKSSDCIYNLLHILRARLTAWEGEQTWLLRIPPSPRSLYGPSGSECCRAQHGVPNAIVTSSLLPWSLSNTTSTSLIICLRSTHSLTLRKTLRSCQIHLVWMRADWVNLESPTVWPRFSFLSSPLEGGRRSTGCSPSYFH